MTWYPNPSGNGSGKSERLVDSVALAITGQLRPVSSPIFNSLLGHGSHLAQLLAEYQQSDAPEDGPARGISPYRTES